LRLIGPRRNKCGNTSFWFKAPTPNARNVKMR
jgi:hypothetical protein